MWAGIKYFFGNIFRFLLVVIILAVLEINQGQKIDSDEILLWVFFLGGYYSCVVGSFYVGDTKVTVIENGFSFGLAFFLYFLAYVIVNFILENASIFMGIAILFFTINRLTHTIKFIDYVPVFFTVTGFISVGLLVLSTVLCFRGTTDGGVGIVIFVLLLEFVNCIARAFQASHALDY